MKKKQIISYYLALQALIMAGCSNHSSHSNHVHESAPDTEVVEAILPDTFVEVDISDQTLYFYKDGELFLTSNVVTGKNSTPTRIGYFDIAYKVMDTRLKGPILANGKRAWDNHVDYWMPFDGDRGFHDAYWRDEFGGTIYENSGSHGCVNMPHDAAQELYENAEAQTRVLIHK